MFTLIPNFLFYISFNLKFTNNTGMFERAETKDQTIDLFRHNLTASYSFQLFGCLSNH
jgi:hypothetical protein